jgi:16S rRNA (uracil1498-N3)-methyltransferase
LRRYLVTELPGPGVELTVSVGVSHHMLRVSGLAPGEMVELYDGLGHACVAILGRVEDGRAVLVGRQGKSLKRPWLELWLLPALLRARVFDEVVRSATELGVAHLWPVQSVRCVAKEGKPERWERIARSALAQSGGVQLPDLCPVQPLASALDRLPDDVERMVLVPGGPSIRPTSERVALFVGPEGGWSEAELTLLVDSAARPLGLGASTLRAQTASVAGLATLLAGTWEP